MTYRLLLCAVVVSLIGVIAMAIPSSITYQGTLREKGIPVTATKNMQFRITNVDGTQVYWSSPNQPVQVRSGLFSAQLSPTSVNWEAITPYMEVLVEGVRLDPREPLTATIYANVAGSVTSKSIKLSNLADEVVVVPPGAILMFDENCPSGWSRFTALDDRFPMGANVSGGTGGSVEHSHPISSDGSHSHQTAPLALGTGSFGAYPTVYGTGGSPGWVPFYPGQNTTYAPTHNHGGSTQNVDGRPPFLKVVFCKKQ